MKKARVQDIAQAAGVSPATVTRVLSGNGYVSTAKRESVIRAAQAIGYDFSQRTERSQLPQVLVFSPPSFSLKNPLYSNIQEFLSIEAQKQGWFCMHYYVTGETVRELSEIIRAVRTQNLKGIVFNCLGCGESISDFRKLISGLSVPVIMIERFPDVFGVNKIMINAKEAVFLAIRHLCQKGHRRIAFFSPDTDSEVERSRIEGFQFALSALGLEQEAHFLPLTAYTAEAGLECFCRYTDTYGLPTAIVSADPVMVGISACLYARGLRVPEDISLIGLDDTSAALMTPALTSVAFPVREIAQTAVQMMLDGSELPRTVSLSTYLIERDSVAVPKK